MRTPYFHPVQIGDEFFDLAHLEPFTMDVDSLAAKRKLRVRVIFSNHCFTTSCEPESTPAGYPVFETSSGPRTFCPIRYGLSFSLPDLIRHLCDPKAKVWETAARRNWCRSIKIDDPEGPYHVFFEIRREVAEDRRKHQELRLTVESAYHEDPKEGPPNLLGAMGFVLLCGKIYMRQPTATRR